MGRSKPLLSWYDTTLVEYQVCSLFDGGVSEVVVVLGHNAEAVIPFVKARGASCVINPDYRQGKTTSIKAGLRCVDPNAEDILLLAVDQPRSRDIVSHVIQAHIERKATITSPRYQGHGGHPLIFSASLKSELERISEEKQGIREVFQAHRDEVYELPVDDPMIRLDLNTPEAYEEARRRYRA